jgi:acyl carrier protein
MKGPGMQASQKVFELISETASLPAGFELTTATPIKDVPGWDSFAWIAILTGIENYCGCDFPIDRVDSLRNVGDLVALAESLLKSRKENSISQ